MIAWIAIVSSVLGVIPVVLFLRNLSLYLPTPATGSPASCSVLIPARNEEANIQEAILSVLANRACEIEVIVFDDESTDQTAAMVEEVVKFDGRVRLMSGAPLPVGWCGKPFACYQMAKAARYPFLIFMDADVRLTPDALSRMVAFTEQSEADLASGVPHQQMRTLPELLLIPLIHFLLLGFLPINRMRQKSDTAYGSGCGQLFIARREAYWKCNGHASIRSTLHDGLKLPRVFRLDGLKTDLFDATDIGTCRMYGSADEVVPGFAKNAHEALASPQLIGPATLMLGGGQCLPMLILLSSAAGIAHSLVAVVASLVATLSVYLVRIVAAFRFRQPMISVILHPLGAGILLAIQWAALVRRLFLPATAWKGRRYSVPRVPG